MLHPISFANHLSKVGAALQKDSSRATTGAGSASLTIMLARSPIVFSEFPVNHAFPSTTRNRSCMSGVPVSTRISGFVEGSIRELYALVMAQFVNCMH